MISTQHRSGELYDRLAIGLRSVERQWLVKNGCDLRLILKTIYQGRWENEYRTDRT